LVCPTPSSPQSKITAALSRLSRPLRSDEAYGPSKHDLAAAKAARERAMLRLTNIRPSDVESAATWIVYLTSLGNEAPSLAQIAAVCAIKAKLVVWSQVIRGPERWFQRPDSIGGV
jgi:hypothetical protein